MTNPPLNICYSYAAIQIEDTQCRESPQISHYLIRNSVGTSIALPCEVEVCQSRQL